jgi:hypothetical protein
MYVPLTTFTWYTPNIYLVYLHKNIPAIYLVYTKYIVLHLAQYIPGIYLVYAKIFQTRLFWLSLAAGLSQLECAYLRGWVLFHMQQGQLCQAKWLSANHKRLTLSWGRLAARLAHCCWLLASPTFCFGLEHKW